MAVVLLGFGLNLGVRGAAIATLIARVITSLMYLIYFIGDKNLIEIKLPNFKPTFAIYKEVLKIGISMLILQILQTISISKISYAASFYGEEAIAAMGIVLRIVTLGTNVVFGYMKGLQPLAGFNYGAKNYERVREAIKASIKWTNVFCVLWTVIVYIFAPSILSIFGTDENVLNIAMPALRASESPPFSLWITHTRVSRLAHSSQISGQRSGEPSSTSRISNDNIV